MSISVRRVIDARVDGASSVNQHHDFATGASSTTFQAFDAISKSSGTLEFNVLVPGQNAYWSRRVMLETTTVYSATLKVSGPQGTSPTVRYGRDIAVCGFPMNSLLQTVTTSINGSTITTQSNQIMPLVRRLIAASGRARKRIPCPSGVSTCADNAQAGIGTGNEIMNNVRGSEDPDTNGSFRVFSWGTIVNGTFAASPDQDALAIGALPTAGAGAITTTTVTVSFSITTREPLLVSPFITTDDEPAFTNVQAANIRCTLMNPSHESIRLIRVNRLSVTPELQALNAGAAVAAGGYLYDDATNLTTMAFTGTSWSAQPFVNAKLYCNFLSPSPDQLVPASTIYPYLQYDPLQSATVTPIKAVSMNTWQAPAPTKVSSQTVILNTCPDMLAVFAIMGEATEDGVAQPDGSRYQSYNGREDLFATIDSLSIMWNNQPAILATARNNELWRMSYDNGLKYGFDVFNGIRGGGANLVSWINGGAGAGTSAAALANGAVSGAIATTGMPVLLAINKDFPTEPGTAPGVAGVFSIQVDAQVHHHGAPTFFSAGTVNGPNTYAADTWVYPARPVTLVIVPIRSQYLQLNAGGTSSVVTAVSSGEAMLDAPFAPNRIIDSASTNMVGQGASQGFANFFSSAKKGWERGKQLYDSAKQVHDKYREHEGAIKGALDSLGGPGAKIKAALESVGGDAMMGGPGHGVYLHGSTGAGVNGYGAGVNGYGAGKRPRGLLTSEAIRRY